MDLESELTINGNANSLSATQNQEPELKTFTYDQLELTSLTINNNADLHRVLIHELEITYIVE